MNLGYLPDKFQRIDNAISQDSFYREQRNRAEKIDRYGKKYSWIAYFEICGMREDRGMPPNRWGDVRVSDCDIDPSFPSDKTDWRPPLKSIFGPFKSHRHWAENGGTPDYKHLLTRNKIQDARGPWVLLDGFINEASAIDNREVFSFLRGLLVKAGDIAKLKSSLSTMEYPGNHAIPDSGDDHYTFAGEIPWSNKFAQFYRTKRGLAKRAVVDALEDRVTRKVRKRIDKLRSWELMAFLTNGTAGEAEEITTTEKSAVDTSIVAAKTRYTDVVVYDRLPGFQVELPTYGFAWESYHSIENQIGSIDFVAPAICQASDLRNTENLVDLFDSAGHIASLFRTFGNWPTTRAQLLYLRKDLLEKYLAKTNQKIIWIVWGERSFKSETIQNLRDELQTIWSKHAHIHKKLIVGRLN